jgi:hypothetical protein
MPAPTSENTWSKEKGGFRRKKKLFFHWAKKSTFV